MLADKSQDVDSHMEMGKAFLAKGQFADALQHYHAAAELDPTNYQIFYRRATVLLATGKMKAALPDLHRVVELKPDFVAVSPLNFGWRTLEHRIMENFFNLSTQTAKT